MAKTQLILSGYTLPTQPPTGSPTLEVPWKKTCQRYFRIDGALMVIFFPVGKCVSNITNITFKHLQDIQANTETEVSLVFDRHVFWSPVLPKLGWWQWMSRDIQAF